jgi:hypothetical protein
MYSDLKERMLPLLDSVKDTLPTYKEIVKMLDWHEKNAKGAVEWCAEDIIERARECKRWYRIPREKEAQEILEYMIRKHDATIGINWDVIDCYLPPKGTKPFENPNMP